MAFYTNSSLIGVDFNTPGDTQLFALGTVAKGNAGSEWVYVEARSAITAFKAVFINATFTCGMPSVTDVIQTATAGGRLGWAQAAFTSGQFGWVPVNGAGVYIMTTGSNTLIAGAVPICLGGSAVSTGMASQVATSTGTLQGVVIVGHGSGGQTASATAAQAILSWPRYAPPSAA